LALTALTLCPLQAGADLASIEVQVIDRINNQPIPGISCGDFEVWEESRPAQIIGCEQAGATARDVLLLLDFSGSYGDEAVQYSGPALLELLRPGDRAAMMWFAGDAVHPASRLTADRKHLQALLDSRPPNGKSFKRSALFDAILAGAQFFSETPDARRPLIVVVTHNREGKSVATDADVVEALLKSSIGLEAVTVPQSKRSQGPLDADWRDLRWLNPSGVDLLGNLGPEPIRKFLDDPLSVERILSKVGGTAVRLDYERSRQIWRGEKRPQWDRNAVVLAIERELVGRLRNHFVLTIRGSSATEAELRRLEVRLTTEAQRAHTAAIVTAPSGYYAKGDHSPSATSKDSGGQRP
jgi:hypothetical protein